MSNSRVVPKEEGTTAMWTLMIAIFPSGDTTGVFDDRGVGYRGDVRQLVDVGDGCALRHHVAGGEFDDHVTDASADARVVSS